MPPRPAGLGDTPVTEELVWMGETSYVEFDFDPDVFINMLTSQARGRTRLDHQTIRRATSETISKLEGQSATPSEIQKGNPDQTFRRAIRDTFRQSEGQSERKGQSEREGQTEGEGQSEIPSDIDKGNRKLHQTIGRPIIDTIRQSEEQSDSLAIYLLSQRTIRSAVASVSQLLCQSARNHTNQTIRVPISLS